MPCAERKVNAGLAATPENAASRSAWHHVWSHAPCALSRRFPIKTNKYKNIRATLTAAVGTNCGGGAFQWHYADTPHPLSFGFDRDCRCPGPGFNHRAGAGDRSGHRSGPVGTCRDAFSRASQSRSGDAIAGATRNADCWSAAGCPGSDAENYHVGGYPHRVAPGGPSGDP